MTQNLGDVEETDRLNYVKINLRVEGKTPPQTLMTNWKK